MSHHDMSHHDNLIGVILFESLLSFTIICLTKFVIKLFIAVKEPNLITINIHVSPHDIYYVMGGHNGGRHVRTFTEHLEN